MHDPRIGRFFAVDPMTDKYPFYSPYSFSGNEVINMVELEGLEPSPTHTAEELANTSGGDFGGERVHTYKDGSTIRTVDNQKYWVNYKDLGYGDIQNNHFSYHAVDPNDPEYQKGWVKFTPPTEEQKDRSNTKAYYNLSDKGAQAVFGAAVVMMGGVLLLKQHQ